MSITTASWNLKKVPIHGTRDYMISVLATVTGDGSGGTIAATTDIVNLLPNDCLVTIIDSGFYNNSAAAELLSTGINSIEWEAGVSGYIAAGNATNVLTTGDSYFVSSINHNNQQLPIYLGKRVSTSATLGVKSNTNTNTKSYGWWFLIKVTTIQSR